MPIKKVVTLTNFNGGLNKVKDRNDLTDGEFSNFINWYLEGGKMKPRPPMVGWPILDGAAAALDGPLGMITLSRSTGTWDLISLGDDTIINVVQGGTSVPLTDSMSLAFNLSTELPWRTTQYKNFGYAVHPDLNYIVRFNDAEFWSAGIAAPSTAAVIADGAAGAVEAGNMIGVFTFVDADGVESSISPVSNTLNHTAGTQVAWSSVDVSTNPRVASRNLYRTLPNQTGEYFYVGNIPNNTATTLSENTTVLNMGDLAPEDNAVPPTKNYIDIEVFAERLWATDGSYLYSSNPENPDGWAGANIYAVSPDDGQPIRAIKRLGSRLMVLKTGSLWAIEQSLGEFEFLPVIVDSTNGCIATKSVCVSDGYIFWFSGRSVFMSDGRNPAVDISIDKLGDLSSLAGTPPGKVVAAVHSGMGWYIIGFCNGTPGGNTFAYDYRKRVWYQLDYSNAFSGTATAANSSMEYPLFFDTVLDVYGKPHILAGFNSGSGIPSSFHDLIDLDATTGDGDRGGLAGYSYAAVAIESTARFKGLDFGFPGLYKSLSRILLACNEPQAVLGKPDGNAAKVDIYIARDEGRETGTPKSRTGVSIDTNAKWKSIGMSTRAARATTLDVTLVRNSRYSLVVEGIQFHAEVWATHPAEVV